MNKEKNELDFLKILQMNDKNKLKKYIFENGKEGKIFCPISFVTGEENYAKKEEK